MSKKLQFLLSLFFCVSIATAQWSRSGSAVYLSNNGDSILINSNTSSTPVAKLTVNGGIRVTDRSGNVSEIIVPPSILTGQAGADENRNNIQNAINRTTQNGGKVILMAGNYPISKDPSNDYCLLLKRGVQLVGSTREATTIMPFNNGVSYNQQLEVIRLQLVSQQDATSMGTIRDLWIYGNGKTNVTGIDLGNYASSFGGAWSFYVENVRISETSIGMLIQSYGSQVNNCIIENNTVGVALRHYFGVPPAAQLSDGTHATTLRDCDIGPSDTAIIISGGGNLLIGNTITSRDALDKYGVWINNTAGYCQNAWCGVAQNNIIGNYFQSTSADPINATSISIGNSPNTYITGNLFDGIYDGKMITFRSGVPEGFQSQSNFGRSGSLSNSTYGTIGINTTNPRGQFDVAGSGDIYLAKDPITGSGQNIYLPGHIYIAPHSGNVSYLQARRSNTSGTTELQLRTCNSGSITEAMRLKGNGNVGIGVVDPIEKLEVTGNIKLGNNPSLKWTGNVLNLEASSGENMIKVLNIKGTSSYAPRFDMQNAGNTNCVIRLEAGAGGPSFINNGGNVGIGTTSPVEKLQVNGKIRANGYQSSDGSEGVVNANIPYLNGNGQRDTLVIKNGLIVGY